MPAALRLVDIAGIVKGASEGQGLGNKFLSHIREVDAILQVVRCFEDPDVVHVAGKVNPVSDIETIEIELMLADIQTLETALPRPSARPRAATRRRRSGPRRSGSASTTSPPTSRCGSSTLDEFEAKAMASFGLMTAKPVLYVANVDETDLEGKGPLVQKQVRDFAAKVGASVVPVCAKLEAEIAELDEADRAEMLASSGLAEPALTVLAREAYRVLGLQSYFTAGEMEVRAWTIPIGATAPQAAGVIHTDFEKGFIRAEVYRLEDLETYKAEKDIRAAGKLRIEGKTYVMQDGDICHFLFN